MGRHFGPVQTRSVVMTEMVPFVHEVHLINDCDGIHEIIFGMSRVTESVLNPRGDCHDEVHAEKRNQHEKEPNSPIVNEDSSEIEEVPRHSPQHASLILYIASGFEVRVGNKPQGRPNVVRKIPKEMQPAGSIIANRGDSIVGSAVLFVVEADMNGPTPLGKVSIQISEKEFDVAAENLVVPLREVALGAVRLQMFGTEHPGRPLKLGTVKGKIEKDHEQEPRFP